MNDHNLDDLIISDPVSAGKKSKSLLAMIALVVIILLIGILLSKMILGTSEDEITIAENNQTEFVSPELIPIDGSKKKNSDLMPMVKEKLPSPVKQIEDVLETKSKKVAIEITDKNKPTKKIISIKEEVEKATKEKEPKKDTATKQPEKKQTKPSALFAEGTPTYFIQIGAFNREPNPKFLKKIESAGLKYIVNKNEKTRRVRVGPYGSYAEAKEALTEVNSSIGIMGFVVKQK